MTGYLLQDRVEFPYQQTHASVFGDTWREVLTALHNTHELTTVARARFLSLTSRRSTSMESVASKKAP